MILIRGRGVQLREYAPADLPTYLRWMREDGAWFSAVVDDEGEFDGKPWGAKDIRWTGVLERRRGGWKICQQHMSQANDKKP